MKFCWVTFKVMDLDKSIAFYENIVGLKLESRRPAGPTAELAFLGVGETKVELICDSALETVDNGKDISIGFFVDSIAEKMDFLKKNSIPLHSGPFEPAPGVKFFYILDPDGLKIQFVEHA